jgi:hypothetical protein
MPPEKSCVTVSLAATVRRGRSGANRLAFANELWASQRLGGFRDGEAVWVTVTGKRPPRTARQNNFLWAYYTLIADDSGHTPEEIHLWAKGMFLTERVVDVYGKPTRVVGSTTRLTKQGFSEFIERISAATGIAPPDTGEL